MSQSSELSESLVLGASEIKFSHNPVTVGGSGRVYRGRLRGESVAIKAMKVYQKSDMRKLLEGFLSEAATWKQLSHPNVLPFYGIYYLDNDQLKACLVSPWMEYGNVVEFLHERAPGTNCVLLSLDIAQGLEYLHSKTIIHGDLKGLNILVSQLRRACLADFGLATIRNSEPAAVTMHGALGTLRWQAPELFPDILDPDSNDIERRTTSATDVYSFALVCYEMFSGQYPFHDIANDFRVILVVKQQKRPSRPTHNLSQARGLSDNIWRLIETCWNSEPSRRLTAGQIVEQLRALPHSDQYDFTSRTAKPLTRERKPSTSERDPNRTIEDLTADLTRLDITRCSADPSPAGERGGRGSEEPPTYTVEEVTANYTRPDITDHTSDPSPSGRSRTRSRVTSPPLHHTVAGLTTDISSLNITKGVQLDPQYPYPIGCGVGGEVYRGLYTWTHPITLQVFVTKVAVKQLISAGVEQQKLDERVRREVANWRSLEHPNVTQFLGIAYVNPGRPPYLVSPYIHRKNILEYIVRHPKLKIPKARDIACGVQYLHSRGIVHGDLNVDNVLVSEDGVAQINDFGMSRILDIQGFTTKILRNIRFNAPELMPIIEQPCDIHPTFESDIFSLGILLLQLFNGHEEDLQKSLPYNHVRNGTAYDLGLLRRIHKGERPIRERYAPMSDQQWELISLCWKENPSARPDIDSVVNKLNAL